jgi:hypothetical protein
MHEKIRELAEKEGVSMNQLGEKILNFLERNWYCLLTLETIYSLCYTTNSYYGHSRECGNLNIARQSAIDSCKAIRFRACLWRQAGIRRKMTNRHIQRVFLYRTHVKINGEPAGVLWFPQDDSLSAVVWVKALPHQVMLVPRIREKHLHGFGLLPLPCFSLTAGLTQKRYFDIQSGLSNGLQR